MYKKESWSLKELVPSDDVSGARRILDTVEQLVRKIELYKTKFHHSMSSSDFNALIDDIEKYSAMSHRVQQYAGLRVSQNSLDAEATAFSAKVDSVCADTANRLLWFSLDFVKFPADDVARLIASCQKARYYLEQIVAGKKFLLTDKEEKIINIKNVNGTSAVVTLYDILTSGFTFPFKGKDVTESELLKFVRDKNPKNRREAYASLFAVFKKHESLFGEMYRAIVADWGKEDVELRGHKSPVAVRNFANDIPDEVIETLMSVAEKNKTVWHKYFRLKARLLKTNTKNEKLSRYDLYAPIGGADETISFGKGSHLVLDTFRYFSPVWSDCAKRLFDEHHIHSSVVRGKDQGAFCSGTIPRIDPYVLLNYTDDPRSVSVLAHELGHAIHFMLATKKQSMFHAHAALPVAETASIFSELLLIEKLKKEKPKSVKSLLFQQVDNAYASIGRQIEFVAFEKEAHELIKNHGSTEDLKRLYWKRLKNHFGSAVDVPVVFESEWSVIPHIFHTPFYCYAYGFGNLLALSLYSAYQEAVKKSGDDGAKMVRTITELLSAGGSDSPAVIVKRAGFDIASESFWQRGFDTLSKMIDDVGKSS